LELHPNIKVLILDNLSSLAPGLDENSKQDWDPIGQWLISIRHMGRSVILFHHSGKQGIQRGTSGREDQMDCIMKLTRPKGAKGRGAHFRVEFEKWRNMGPGASRSPFDIRLVEVDEEGHLEWRVDDTDPDDIYYALIMKPEIPLAWIAKRMEVTKQAISPKRKRAEELRLIDKNRNPTKSGREYLKDIGQRIDLESLYQEYYERHGG
jgi:hypothetical protein